MATLKLFPERVGTTTSPTQWKWSPKDCALYALSVGAGFTESTFVLPAANPHSQTVYPTFALALVSADANARSDPLLGIGEFEASVPIVLGEQALYLHRPLQPSGEVAIDVRITGLFDKGSGAVVVLDARAVDAFNGAPAFTAVMSMFIVGAGNFGGGRGPKRPAVVWPERPPDRRFTCLTSPFQSLLYMHAGNDDHPIHVNLAAALAAGFDGPILTGQNSVGIACRAIIQEVCEGEPGVVRSISGQFAKPAYNGDSLTTEMWLEVGRQTKHGIQVLYRVVNQQNAVIVDHGRCELTANGVTPP